MNIEINQEYKSLIPPLSSEEYAQLEKNIIADGCREPLIVFENTLIDGHNRYEICTKHDLPFSILEKNFADNSAVKLWMIDNQNGRRNLTDGWKYQLSQSKKAILLEAGRVKHAETAGKSIETLSIVDNVSKHNTREVIAADLGWSAGKVAMADKVWKDATPEIKEQVLSGEASINEAYKAVKAGDTHVGKNTGENEWYTPERFIESARAVLGRIDLDPASSTRANETVKAGEFFSIDDNGLRQEWHGNVWMNPPYAQPLMTQFAEKLVYEMPNLSAAIVLVNNATETKWFQLMARAASAVCFPESRIKFIDRQGKESGSPLQGQCFLYFGTSTKSFDDNFSKFGFVMINA